MELHYMDRDFRTLDLAEKMAERHKRSPAATLRSSLRIRMAWTRSASAEKYDAWRMVRERSKTSGRA